MNRTGYIFFAQSMMVGIEQRISMFKFLIETQRELWLAKEGVVANIADGQLQMFNK